jgi:hypothetical protein
LDFIWSGKDLKKNKLVGGRVVKGADCNSALSGVPRFFLSDKFTIFVIMKGTKK